MLQNCKDQLHLLLDDFCTGAFSVVCKTTSCLFFKGVSNANRILEEELWHEIAEILSFTVGIFLIIVHVCIILLKLWWAEPEDSSFATTAFLALLFLLSLTHSLTRSLSLSVPW